MEKTTEYAQLRYQIAQLEAKAKEMESAVLEELKESKADTTQYGKVQVVETKVYDYSQEFLAHKLLAESEIKRFSEEKKAVIKEMQVKEEETLTPEIKKSVRFTAVKEVV